MVTRIVHTVCTRTVVAKRSQMMRFTKMAEWNQLTFNRPKRGFFLFRVMDHCRQSKTFKWVFNEPDSFITSCTYLCTLILFFSFGILAHLSTKGLTNSSHFAAVDGVWFSRLEATF